MMHKKLSSTLKTATHILIIQAENPDGDSLGASLGLESILENSNIKTTMYCAVNIPKYLRYFSGWDRVTDIWPNSFDAAIIVDTSSAALLEKTLTPSRKSKLESVPTFIFDHHETKSTLSENFISITDSKAVATCELVYDIAKSLDLTVNPDAATPLAAGILSDSLGLTTPNTTAESIRRLADMVELGASLNEIETRRHEYMKKSKEILGYKGRLLQRIEYHLDNQLALIHIPWEEIEEYSDQYNPSVLVLYEMRLVEDVKVAVALKTYPDGKITGKIQCNPDAPVAETVAGYFGGGGHLFAAGFKVYDEHIETVKQELLTATFKSLEKVKTDEAI